ncbi:MAG: hypothetical protein QF415_06130 [Candidatus Undinarchaeales archaeon]|nr:hypothetical protein [Candidatus Undinarchaeales archaeon]
MTMMETQGNNVPELATMFPAEAGELAAATLPNLETKRDHYHLLPEHNCTVCGRPLEEQWEYLPCDACGATVCSECIAKADGHRVCPVCTSELEPWTGLDSGITGVETDATWEDDLSEWGVEEIPAAFT